ncbi:hypothetical protein FIBSPDRAFT_901405 [Athelia psychrophila]|uniref:Uncharacterized protein n=1 Tax=Athelia psychrophila TaxID=1759441 RepID=A0A165X6J5_9AGAM|nr:hypothetical protein FIBSPDRAFT_901405 [Fibularhizoctonia sp. CBS 109695]
MSTGSVSLLLGKYPPSSTQKSLVKVLQWLSRAAPSLPPTLVIHDTATEFYANYPAPPEESLDDIVPPLPSFDDTATAHFLPAGLPGITVKHVCKCYQNTDVPLTTWAKYCDHYLDELMGPEGRGCFQSGPNKEIHPL